MLWDEARKTYPNKWIVYDSLSQFEQNNKLIVTDLAIIEVFDNLDAAYKYYCKLHKEICYYISSVAPKIDLFT